MRLVTRAAPTLVTVIIGCGVAAPNSSGAVPAFDHAGEAEYDDGWQNGDNGGFGFGVWRLSGAVFEMRSSTGNNSPATPPAQQDIDSPPGRSFAIWNLGPDGQFIDSTARRRLIGALSVGQSITWDMDSSMSPNEESALRILTSTGGTRFRVANTAGIFYVSDAGQEYRPFAAGRFGDRGVHFEFTLTGPDSYVLSYDSRADPATVLVGTVKGSISGALAGEPAGGIEMIALDRLEFASTGGPVYFNNIAVTPEPSTAIIVVSAILLVRRPNQSVDSARIKPVVR
jgi:hypothetical protein